jgi:hypothetical protein
LLSEIVENRISVVASSIAVFVSLNFILYRILILTTPY